MRLYFECGYCGLTWDDYYYGNSVESLTLKCKCGETKNIKVKEHDKCKIDFYAGAPPFKKDWEFD